MHDEWRLHLTVDDEGLLDRLRDRLAEIEVADELRLRVPRGLVVIREGPELFVYGADRPDIEGGRELLERLAADHGLAARIVLNRWHPEEERWEAPDVPLPDAEGREREHAARMAAEARASAEHGHADWEVRVELPTHHEAAELAEQLDAAGIPNARAWRWLRVGAATEDDAVAVAERIRALAGPGASIVAPEGSATDAWEATHPLWWLGGLAN